MNRALFIALVFSSSVVSVTPSAHASNLFSNFFSKKTPTTATSPKDIADLKGQMQNVLNILRIRTENDALRQKTTTAVNNQQYQSLRQELAQIIKSLQLLENQRQQRIEQLTRDSLGLKNDLKSRYKAGTQQYNKSKADLLKIEADLKLLKQFSNDAGNFVKNVYNLDAKHGGNYDIEYIKKYEELEKSYKKAKAAYGSQLNSLNQDPALQDVLKQEGALLSQQAKLVERLKAQLQQTFSGQKNQALDGAMKSLAESVKKANCPTIKSIADVNDSKLRDCFVGLFQRAPSLLTTPSCRSIAPASPKAPVAINRDQPLTVYSSCAHEIVANQAAPQNVKQTTSAPTPKATKIDILLLLETQRQQLQNLSLQVQQNNKAVNQAGNNAFQAKSALKASNQDYKQQMQDLSNKLATLEKAITIARKQTQIQLDTQLDKLYTPEKNFKAQVKDALLQEDGGDLAEQIITDKLTSALNDKAGEFARFVLGKIPGVSFVLQQDPRTLNAVKDKTPILNRVPNKVVEALVDPNVLMSSLRASIADYNRDLADINRFKKSQIYSNEMDAALQRLNKSYPYLGFKDTAGLLGQAWRWLESMVSTPQLGPTRPGNYPTLMKNANTAEQTYRQQSADVINRHSHDAQVLTTAIQQGIKNANCPSITGLNNLTQTNIASCLNNELNTIQASQKSAYPECQGTFVAGKTNGNIFSCAQALQAKKTLSPQQQVQTYGARFATTSAILRNFAQADNVRQEAKTQIVPGQKEALQQELIQAKANLKTLSDNWLKERQEKLKNLQQRRELSAQNYQKLAAELTEMQTSMINFLSFLAEIEDITQRALLMLTVQTQLSTVPETQSNQPPLAQRVAKAKSLVANLSQGISKLERMVNDKENDPRYQKNTLKYQQAVAQISNALKQSGDLLESLSNQASDVIAVINKQAQELKCASFQRFGDGPRGVQQCRAQYVATLKDLGVKLKDANCSKLDLNSRTLDNDVNRCLAKYNNPNSR